MPMSRTLRLFVFSLCLSPFLATAGEIGEAVGIHKPDKNNFEEPEPVGEESLRLPSYPKESDLIEFYVGPRATNRFFVDGNSLSVGKDGIVRYTLLVRTSGGATNVSYEGIQCSSREFKIYAVGNADGTWSANRMTEWRLIENKLVNRHHAALNRDFLCPIGNPIYTAEEGRNALRRGKHPLVP
jgi:hypothetical protein